MQSKKNWLLARKIGIGGSECAAVLGISKWKTPLQVYLDKINLDDDFESKKEVTEAMRWGNILEPIIIAEYEKIMNVKCEKPEEQLQNPTYPWLIANIDSFVLGKNLILEAKTTRFFDKEWGEQFTDNVPVQYLIQCAHYCIVCDHYKKIERADLAVLGATNKFRIYHYYRNKELEDAIIQKTHDFWYEHVLKEIPPDVTALDDISKLYNTAKNEKFIVADNEVSEKYYRLKRIKECLDKISNKREIIENELKMYIKENEILLDVDGSELASWKNQERNTVDSKSLMKLYPDVYKAIIKKTESRVFRVK
jgi:putative phage-type endonuclease